MRPEAVESPGRLSHSKPNGLWSAKIIADSEAMSSNLIPKFARVVVKRESLQSKTSLIIIPDEADKRNAPSKGVVVAKGPTADESIEIGSTVIFGQYAGAYFKFDDEEWYCLQDEDIIAEVKDE